MNIIELYEQTPVERHKDIIADGNRILVSDEEGDITEYLLDGVGELWLVRSDKKLRADIAAIKSKLDIVGGS